MADVEGEEEGDEALDMSWPDTARKRVTYLLVAPIVFPLWFTLPDARTPRGRSLLSTSPLPRPRSGDRHKDSPPLSLSAGKKFFVVTFLGSIVWIAAYSYLMVWWANVAGDTIKIPPEVRRSLK